MSSCIRAHQTASRRRRRPRSPNLWPHRRPERRSAAGVDVRGRIARGVPPMAPRTPKRVQSARSKRTESIRRERPSPVRVSRKTGMMTPIQPSPVRLPSPVRKVRVGSDVPGADVVGAVPVVARAVSQTAKRLSFLLPSLRRRPDPGRFSVNGPARAYGALCFSHHSPRGHQRLGRVGWRSPCAAGGGAGPRNGGRAPGSTGG